MCNAQRPGARRRIAHQPSQNGKMLAAQRIFPLQKKQEPEEKNNARIAGVIEQRNRFHYEIIAKDDRSFTL
jgi:hypothetical protein